QFAREVVAGPAEDPVLADAHADVEVPRLPTGSPRFPSPGNADPRAILPPGRHLHLHGPCAPYRSAAVARGARGLDRSARSRAGRAGLLHLEEALVHGNLPGSPAGRADDRLGARSGARPMTGRAHRRAVERDGDGHARHRVVERQTNLGLEVSSASLACLRPASASARTTEHPAEQVGEVADVHRFVPEPAGPSLEARATCAREPSAEATGAHLAHTVVGGALLLITEDVVRGGDLLEPLLGLGVAGVRIGVVLLRELPIGLLDLGRGRVLGHAEDLVVVLLEPLAADLLGHLQLTSFRPAPPPGAGPFPSACIPDGTPPRRAARRCPPPSASAPHAASDRTAHPPRRSAGGPRPSTHPSAWRRRVRSLSGTDRGQRPRGRAATRA